MAYIDDKQRLIVFDLAHSAVTAIQRARSNSVFAKTEIHDDGQMMIKVRVSIEESEKSNGK